MTITGGVVVGKSLHLSSPRTSSALRSRSIQQAPTAGLPLGLRDHVERKVTDFRSSVIP